MQIGPQNTAPSANLSQLTENLPALSLELKKALTQTKQFIEQATQSPDQINEAFCEQFASSILNLSALSNACTHPTVNNGTSLGQALNETGGIIKTILGAEINV